MKLYTARYPIYLTCIQSDGILLRAIDATGGRLLLDEVSSGGRYRDFHFEAEEVTEEFRASLRKDNFDYHVTLLNVLDD